MKLKRKERFYSKKYKQLASKYKSSEQLHEKKRQIRLKYGFQ